MGVEIVGLSRLNAEIRAIMGRVDDLFVGIEPEVKRYLDSATQARYDSETDPSGTPWKPLSPAYRASKRKRESVGANRILVLDDNMRRSYKSFATKTYLDYGTNDFKAIWHQEGRGRLPVREHLGLNSDNVMRIGEIAIDYLENSIV